MVQLQKLLKMKNNIAIAILVLVIQNCFSQNIFVPKLTGNNKVSLTDVIYVGNKDSVIVSKYNGDINPVINNKSIKKITNLKDEVYALAYNKNSKELLASTLENGIYVLSFPNGKILKKLSVNKSWTNTLKFSSDHKYLIGENQYEKPILWEINKGYQKVSLSEKIPNGSIIDVKENIATIHTKKKIILWDLNANTEIDSREIDLSFFSDIDNENNILSIITNEIIVSNPFKEKVYFKLKHPDYKWHINRGGEKKESVEEMSLAVSCALFFKNYILSSGADKSLRVWDKNSGKLLRTFWEHKGIVNKIAISKDNTQIVTIDLKGGIKFWDTSTFDN